MSEAVIGRPLGKGRWPNGTPTLFNNMKAPQNCSVVPFMLDNNADV